MLAEPVSASDIAARVAKTTHPDLKNSRVVPMHPDKGYISLVVCCLLRLFPFSPCLFLDHYLFAEDGDRQGFPASCPRGQGDPGQESGPERRAEEGQGGQEGEGCEEGVAARDLRQEPPQGREGRGCPTRLS